MSIVLSNKHIEISIDLPEEGYTDSRFDHSGKVIGFQCKGIELLATELEHQNEEQNKAFGRGLYNEFGMANPLGFNEAKIGAHCHKIGAGLVLKEDCSYNFQKPYSTIPLQVAVEQSEYQVSFRSIGRLNLGYAYVLHKSISLKDDGILIEYRLENTGTKVIKTQEYNHNFLRFQDSSIGGDYRLSIPTELRLHELTELVNKEKVMSIKDKEIEFVSRPTEAFFISTELNNRDVDAFWKLENKTLNIGITETGDFKTKQFHLWGTSHVICPEVFIDIEINPGGSFLWSRRYKVYELE